MIAETETVDSAETGGGQASQPSKQPSLMRAYSRREMRRMLAQVKRMRNPKRGTTKPLHNQAKKKTKRLQQKLSRKANR